MRVVFCDINKAFDRVWPKGLLNKLENIGIQGSLLLWIKHYLTDRKQRVV
jgi:methylaspartate ammonia-lyase